MGKAASYLQHILDQINDIHKLTEDGESSRTTVSFNKEKCKYLAQKLSTKIQPKIKTSLLPTVRGDTVEPVILHIAFAVQAAELLVKRSCEEKWWNEIFWRGDSTEAFGDVLLNLLAAIDDVSSNPGSKYMLGQTWNSRVLDDRSFLKHNIRHVIQHKLSATGKSLQDMDLEIAKRVQARLFEPGTCNVIQLKTVRAVGSIGNSITCIKWHRRECVLKRFESDEQAKREADIMKDLMHPHVVLLIGYALRRRHFSQPSQNILLEYAERGDLHQYIKNLHKDLKADVIVNVMLEIAKGMCYIHSKNIAHLDLKSMNVFVTSHTIPDLHAAKFFHVKIGDFGTAIRCSDGHIPEWIYGQGTTRWRAPELFKEASRSELDLFKADVYSYAMVCVELVTRQLPLHEQFPKVPTSSKVYAYVAVANSRPSLPDTYPPGILSIIRQCWDAKPSRRPSFEQIVESLKTLRSEMLLSGKFYSALPKEVDFKRGEDKCHRGKKEEGGGYDQVHRPLEDAESVKKASMSPIFVIRIIHPPFSVEGCAMLIQLGKDVKRKIDDFVHGEAPIDQYMYTSRASHLRPILGKFQAQLDLLFGSRASNSLVTGRKQLFDEMFNVLKKVEFLLGSCSWPAIEFHGGPTATDEAFLSLWKNLDHCVQMMRYSSTFQRTSDASFEKVPKYQLEDPIKDSWSQACESDHRRLLRFLCSCTMMYPGIHKNHHWYMGSIAVISKDSKMYSEGPAAFGIPSKFVKYSDKKELWDEGPDGLILGPMPFLISETHRCRETKKFYHQRAVLWAVKVYERKSRKLAYEFTKLASLQHPHVMQMFGAWEDGNSGYVAMKMMQTNVMQFLSQKQDKKLSAVLLLTILVQIAEGMSYMHSHHVRHHNLKCSNVLVGGIYKTLEIVHVEVSDYGFERLQVSEEDRELEPRNSTAVAIKNRVQFGKGAETDKYGYDVYQFAVLCSKIFSIRGCRENSKAPPQATSSASDEAVMVSFPAKCPRDLALYLQKCGSKDPAQRPKFAEICTVLRNHRDFLILRGDQGTGTAARK